jgi:hypothetical protein
MNHDTLQPTLSARELAADMVRFLEELPQEFPTFFPKTNSAAWLLRQRDVNGLSEIIRWVGRTAFVSRLEFARWVTTRCTQKPRTDAQRAASAKNLSAARANAKARRAGGSRGQP